MSKLFADDSYWYFIRKNNYIGMHEYISEDYAKKQINGILNGLRKRYNGGKMKSNDIPLDFIRPDVSYKGGNEIKVREGKDYLYPLILFAKNGKLMVKASLIDDDDGLEPYYSYFLDKDFVYGDYNMDEYIYSAIKRRFGVKPIVLHHIGERFLNLEAITNNTEGIPRIFDEDDEDDEDDIEGHIDVSEQDVILCTDWEGDFINIHLDKGESLAFVEPNKFYHVSDLEYNNADCSLLGVLRNEVGSYYVWGNLLYHLVGLEKMQSDK